VSAVRTTEQVSRYALRLGDDALILTQRLSEWSSRAPELEEDVALTNIALDLLGQARVLLSYAAELEGAGRTEDDLAYLRDERQLTNVQLVEQPNGDFGATIARQLLFSHYQLLVYGELRASADPTLAAVASKAVKEVAYHVDHAEQWTRRLGDGTDESHERMQAGLDAMWPFVAELFDSDDLVAALVGDGIAADPSSIQAEWEHRIDAVLGQATLARPTPSWRARGGRDGVHSEHMGFLLAEMQHLHRSHPGATW
jgi:ring-1,2-phenylacetyl-CoA epoxidase subunit PaaC